MRHTTESSVSDAARDDLLDRVRANHSASIDNAVQRLRALTPFAQLDDATLRSTVADDHSAVLDAAQVYRAAGLKGATRPTTQSVKQMRADLQRAVQVAVLRLTGESLSEYGRQLAEPDAAREQITARFAQLVSRSVSGLCQPLVDDAVLTELTAPTAVQDEQAALRRVATTVARGAPGADVFTAVAKESARLFGIDDIRLVKYEGAGQLVVASVGAVSHVFPVGSRQPLEPGTTAHTVFRTGKPARMDHYVSTAGGSLGGALANAGIRSVVATPIVVEGRLWGALGVGTTKVDALPPDTEARLSSFTELIGAAIANNESRARADRLAQEQASLRRVATLVAQEAAPDAVLTKVAEEVGELLGVEAAVIHRYDSGGAATVLASWGHLGTEAFMVGHTWLPDADTVTGRLWESGRPARVDDPGRSGSLTANARRVGLRSAVGSPITVDGRLWGGIVAGTSRSTPLAADAESRIAQFTELVATAIANVQAREEVLRLAHEQAALRRVATMVARERPACEVFSQVAKEVGELLGAEQAAIHRNLQRASTQPVGVWRAAQGDRPISEQATVASSDEIERWLGECRRSWEEKRSLVGGLSDGRTRSLEPQRIARSVPESWSAVASPIVTNDEIWGVIVATGSHARPLGSDAELRIAAFTELAATAIANLQARAELAESRARFVAAGDDERRQVVRDLHDGAQQRLVQTVVTLKLLRRALTRAGGDLPPLLDEALQHAETANEELRELAHGILPSVLSVGGLSAAIRSLTNRMPIPVTSEVAAERLPATIESTAYFVIAESLTNVAKHAQASEAKVRAWQDGLTFRVEVTDDGRGGAIVDGTGLLGLRDRLSALDGNLDVDSPPGGGTSVSASIPIAEESPATES